jgi:hypothetical protein
MVALLINGLPKLGVLSLSSIFIRCIFAALNPAKPSSLGSFASISGHVLILDSILFALALGRYAKLPLLGAHAFYDPYLSTP